MSKIIQIKNGQPYIAGSVIHKKVQLQVELEKLDSLISKMSEVVSIMPGDIGNIRYEIEELRKAYILCAALIARME